MPGEMDALEANGLEAAKNVLTSEFGWIGGGGEGVAIAERVIRAYMASLSRRSAVTAPAVKALSAYELQVLIGTSISGRNMPPDETFNLPAAWQRLYELGLIDRTDGLAIATEAGQARIDAALSALEPIPPSGDFVLVPREPTEAMLRAGIDNCALSIQQDRAGHRQMTTPFEDECGSIYRAMLAATPSPTSLLEPNESARMTEDQIKHMVNRFLGWHLPQDFHPDGGISFERIGNRGTQHEYRHQPSGTNLLDATQAREMVLYMLDGLPAPSLLEPGAGETKSHQ